MSSEMNHFYLIDDTPAPEDTIDVRPRPIPPEDNLHTVLKKLGTEDMDEYIGLREWFQDDPLEMFPSISAEDIRSPLPRHLPLDAQARKDLPVATGFVDYFPDAIAAVAELSRIGNDQHNPGKSLHWDRSKSGDESDALMRHFLERGTKDVDGVRHSVKVAWRAMAMLQKEIENEL